MTSSLPQNHKNNNITVSICCITYNHASFIRECIDGFLMQKTDFPIEIIIHDDCSTDGTDEIIKEYVIKYPNIIHPVYQKENQFSQGIRDICQKFVFPLVKGKYVALCEGDDYWTDPLKLQKQVDFMENNLECSLCFHPVNFVSNSENDIISLGKPGYKEELFNGSIIPTCSSLFRRNIIKEIPSNPSFFMSDIVIWATCYFSGKLYAIENTMAVYRRHPGSWSSNSQKKICLLALKNYIALRESFQKKLSTRIFDERIIHSFASLKRAENWNFFKASYMALKLLPIKLWPTTIIKGFISVKIKRICTNKNPY